MMDTYARLNALANLPHTCGPDWTVACWACEASSLLNAFNSDVNYLLARFDAAQVEVTKASTTP